MNNSIEQVGIFDPSVDVIAQEIIDHRIATQKTITEAYLNKTEKTYDALAASQTGLAHLIDEL